MREIKFRAWEKSYKRMSKVTEIKWKEEHLYHQIFTQAIVNNKRIDDSYTYDFSGVSNGIVLMQYTGLKDKNGVEIYEGDIITTDLERSYLIVEYRNAAFMLNCNDGSEDYYDIFFGTSEEPKEVYKYGEVIGNIYDNSELVEGKK